MKQDQSNWVTSVVVSQDKVSEMLANQSKNDISKINDNKKTNILEPIKEIQEDNYGNYEGYKFDPQIEQILNKNYDYGSYQNLNLGMSSGLGNLGSSYLGGGSYNFNTNYQSSYNNYQSLLPNAVLPSSSLPSGNYNNMFDDSDTKKKGSDKVIENYSNGSRYEG